jgi:3-phenylpropionate/cinnamic acid dioxygenase small subunit
MNQTLRSEAEELILREVRLLDDRRFDDWLALYTPNCRYWAPVSPEQTSPREGVSHFHDDMQIMMARTHRLETPRAFGAEPAPRTCHIMSGVIIEAHTEESVIASASMMMAEYRNRGQFEADQRLFAGKATYTLVTYEGGMRIKMKRVDLINAEGPFNAMAAPF